MKKYLLILLILLTVGFFSCDEDVPTPACIEAELANFQISAACVGDNLASWDFQGEKVYCFAYGTCLGSGTADIYDSSCNLVCTIGGNTGLTTCNGVPWLENASNEQLIWEKEN